MALALVGMPASEPRLRRDLALWMVALRRITVLAGLGATIVHLCLVPGELDAFSLFVIMGTIAAYNEAGRSLLGRVPDARVGRVVNGQIALDTIALTALLHFAGGLTSIGILFFAPAFCAYGAILPVTQAFAHVALATIELTLLGVAERYALLAHQASGFYLADTYQKANFIALTVVYFSTVNGLCAYLSHYLSQLLSKEEEQSRLLASERGVLLARNEREAACVRALLDVAQHVSAIHKVDELLHAVCDTTVALVRVPRVEIFLWDARRSGLTLAAARGLAHEAAPDNEVRYGAELPIVARLRAGEVVQFGAAPSRTLAGGRLSAPFRRGFAAPMVCRDSFEGALFVGYDDENAEELMALVQGIARQAALALVNVRALEQQQEDAEVSRVLLDISQGLSACLDEDALWTMLVRGASEVLGLPWSVATRFDEHAGSFSIAGASGLPDTDMAHVSGARFRLEEHPRLQESLASCDLVVSDGSSRPFAFPSGVRVGSWVGIPLIRGGWIAGILTAGSGDPKKTFSRRQLRLAEGLGHHASIALQNARLVADLEAADRLKSEFVSTMSHELRTPLNVIIGYTEMLREGAVGPITTGQHELIDRLDARGRELLELIEATLHVGRLEAGRDSVELAAIEMPELVRALQACTAGLPRPPTVGFDWEVPVTTRQQITTDRAKLALVVRNLVSNALKFTAEGKVVVRMSVRDDTLTIEVSDTGIGISEEHLPLIFDMFRQVDGSTTRRHGGVGLGLYIVKQFVTRLGGTVSVLSTPGRGSRFRVVLPGVVHDERRDLAEASAA